MISGGEKYRNADDTALAIDFDAADDDNEDHIRSPIDQVERIVGRNRFAGEISAPIMPGRSNNDVGATDPEREPPNCFLRHLRNGQIAGIR